MAASEFSTVNLSSELAERLERRRVERHYDSVEEVIREGLEALELEPESFELWLREEIIPACEEYERDPMSSRTSEQLSAALIAEYHRALRSE